MDLQEYHSLAIRTINPAHTPLQNLNNAALGLAGEFAEIVSFDKDNFTRVLLVKELGDLLWYTVQASISIDKTLDRIVDYDRNFAFDLNDASMIVAIGEIADIVKKVVFHEHPFLESQKVAIGKSISVIVHWIRFVGECYGIEFEEIMQTNIDKLRKRYPAGFNSQDSINRAE